VSAVLTKALAEVRRRRLQSLLIAGLILFASGTMTIGLTLVQESNDPFDRAFAEQRGAHLQVRYQADRVTAQQLTETPAEIGAASAAGPWPTVPLTVRHGESLYPISLEGRESPGGPVGILRITNGRWLEAPDEVVIPRSFAQYNHISIGDRLVTLHAPSKPVLTVVGEAVDIDQGAADQGNSQAAWVLPEALPGLTDPGQEGSDLYYVMLYRFPGTPDQTQLRRAADRLRAALPPGAVAAALDYAIVRRVFAGLDLFIEAFLITFGLLALAAAVATIANLVIGLVIASYREIGIMKAIGFTPGQVVATLEAQMLIPALAGCAVGIPLGMLISPPLVDLAAQALGIPSHPAIAPLMGLVALAMAVLAVAASAVLPARRAGRLSAVAAISAGSAPPQPGPSALMRAIQRLRFRPSIRLGLGFTAARRTRMTLALVGLVVGVSTLVFAYAAPRYIKTVPGVTSFAHPGEVSVDRLTSSPSDEVITRAIETQPETKSVIASGSTRVVVSGITDPVLAYGFRGDANGRLPLVTGRWFEAPGEAVAPLATINEAHLHIGDTFEVTTGGRSVRLRLVGEIVYVINLGRSLFFDWDTLQAMVAAPQVQSYVVTLRGGADAAALEAAIRRLEPDGLSVRVETAQTPPSALNFIYLLTTTLALLMATVAAAGVFVSTLLNTQERVRDVGILRSLGMTPGQVMEMVMASAVAVGVAGGLVGLLAGALGSHGIIAGLLAGFAGNGLPASADASAFQGWFPALALTGVLMACLGAWAPGRWASRKGVADVLRSE
jgi:putative ABC transport system permease protein